MAAAAASGGGGSGGSGVRASPAPSVASAPLAYEWDDKLVLRGHTKPVKSLALLPGGLLASGDFDGSVRLWDATRGGEATAVLEGPEGEVSALAAFPDGRRLAVGLWVNWKADTGAIVVWDTGVVPPIRRATIDCSEGVRALAVLQDGRLAAGCREGNVQLVDVGADAGAVTATLEGHRHDVVALAVLPGGILASGSWDKMVGLWDVGTGTCVAVLAGHGDNVNALAVLADGRLASGSFDATVRLWDVGTRTCVGVLKGHTHWVKALVALPDGRLASGSMDRTTRVWDTRPATGVLAVIKRVWRRTTPVVVLEGLAFDAVQLLPGARIASGQWSNTVRLWRLAPL